MVFVELNRSETKAWMSGYTISDEMSVKNEVSPMATTFLPIPPRACPSLRMSNAPLDFSVTGSGLSSIAPGPLHYQVIPAGNFQTFCRPN
jgi:hypothetical protein